MSLMCMFVRCLLVLLTTDGAAALVARADVTPVQKVTELLVKMRNVVQEEGKAEAISYDKYACFCKEQADNKVYALKKADLLIEELQAAINDLDGQVNLLSSELVTLRTDVGKEAGEIETAKGVRQGAFTSYQTERQNLTSGIEAIANALEALRNSRDSLSEAQAAAALTQVQAISGLYLNQTPKAYNYSSNDIISTLQVLQQTFKSKLDELDKDEAASAHQHNMAQGARRNTIAALEASIDQKEMLSANKNAEKIAKQGLLDKETAARAADQSFLDELTAGCTAKAAAWDERSRTRAAEITKMTEAISSLENLGGLYSVNKRLTGFMLKGRREMRAITPHRINSSFGLPVKPGGGLKRTNVPTSFLQLAAHSSTPWKVIAFLEQHAQMLHSSSLAQLAAAVRFADDPFVKVRGLIKDLITRLESEATNEANQKGFCDQEMGKAVTARDSHHAEMEKWTASIEATTAIIEQHKTTIAALSEDIAALSKAVQEMAGLRAEEKATNAKTIADADAGKKIVEDAIKLLSDFYAGVFIQFVPKNSDRYGKTVSDLAPETFSEPYDGKLAESKGVISLLEIIAQDFDRTSTRTAQAETAAESDFQKQKTSMEQSISDKEGIRTSEETAMSEKETDLVGFKDSLKSDTELHASAIAQLESLKSSCTDMAESYAQRRQRRAQEIEALQEAKRILEEWNSR